MAASTKSWWLDHSEVPEPPVTPPECLDGATAEVVVVGLGASGLEAVVELASRGMDVLAVDAAGVAAGAAGANGGFLLAGLADFHHDAVTRHDGIPAEDYEGPEGVGLMVPGDGVVQPVARCRRLAHQAMAAGARLVAPARVTSVGPGLVHFGAQSVPCPAVLIAVDGGLERLRLHAASGDLTEPLVGGVRTARLQMLATAPLRNTLLPRPVYRRFGHDYAQQLPTGEILVGGGRDVGGTTEWGAPASPSAAVQAHLDDLLLTLGWHAPVTRRWAASAAFSDSGLPVMDEVARGVHVVGGYSGHGNVLGGLLAREAATRISGC
ncbi:MAG: NAD(P)/FAD-dependent oxidoreductase [Euzebya sp.]